MDFVITVLRKVFGYTVEKCVELMLEAHEKGRAAVWVGALEVAELKADQIRSCGADPHRSRRARSRSASASNPPRDLSHRLEACPTTSRTDAPCPVSRSHAFIAASHRACRAPARLRAAFLGLLASCSWSTSVKYAAKVAKPGDSGQQSRSAFLRWRTMIHDVFAGANVYVGKNEYPNPPVMAIVLRPFAELPPVVGALAWFYAKVLMAVLAAVWVFRLVERE